MENQKRTAKEMQEQSQKEKAFRETMKHNTSILKLEGDFWEQRYRIAYFKTQTAQLEAEVEAQIERFKKESEHLEQQMKEEMLATQGELPSEMGAEPIEMGNSQE